jgi:hypothetical protein
MPNYGAFLEDPELQKLGGRRLFPPPEVGTDIEDFGQYLGDKQQAETPLFQPSTTVDMPITERGFPDKFAPATPSPTAPSSNFRGALPLVASIGAEMLGGKQTAGGTIGNIIAGGMQSQVLSEQYKKMMADYLAGGGGGNQGFQSSSEPGIGGLSAMGLTPEQVTGVYDKGMKLRSEEREFPLKQIGILADATSKISTSEAHRAQIPYYLAHAVHLKAQIAAMPTTTRLQIMEKMAAMKKIDAEVTKLNNEAALQPLRVAKERAEILNIGAQAVQRVAETNRTIIETGPEWEKAKAIAGRAGIPNKELDAGDWKYLINTENGNIISTYKGMPSASASQSGFSLAVSDFLDPAMKAYFASFKDKEQAARSWNSLMTMLNDPTKGGPAAMSTIRGLLPYNQKVAFGAAYKVYADELKGGGNLEQATIKAKAAVDRSLKTMARPATKEDITRIFKATSGDPVKAMEMAEKEGLDVSGYSVVKPKGAK